jgi:hypothetical protein
MKEFKIILSRKGLDSSNSNKPSPICEDGSLISLPIPSDDHAYYSDYSYQGYLYDEMINSLGISLWHKEKRCQHPCRCHCDPDIYDSNKVNTIQGWQACFGQHGASQLHLCNKKIKKGDIFLFFGWFRQTEIIDGKVKYLSESQDQHIIYGYMEIGEILTKPEDIKQFNWHPHAQDKYLREENNALYLPSKTLSDTNLPGYGTFKYSSELVLTKEGYSRSKWELPKVLQNSNLTYHSETSKKNDYFQSARIGQEFVTLGNEEIKKWVTDLIETHRV